MTDKEPTSSIHDIGDEFRKNEENFHLIFDQIPYILEIFTPDGMTVMVNRQWEETYQTDKSLVIGKFNLLEDPQIKELGILPLLQKAFNGELVVMPDSEFDPAKSQYPGRKRWLRTKVIPIKDTRGEVKFVAIMHEDITERKHAEDALRESEEKYRNIFNSILDIYFETDFEGKIIELSPAIERITEYKRDELIGKSAFDLYADPHKKKDFATELTTENVINDYEMALIQKNGQEIIVSISAELERDAAGKPLKIRGTMRDITERMEMQEALRQAHDHLEDLVVARTAELASINKELEAFSYSVSHDLRSPLRQINGYLDALQESTANMLDKESQLYMGKITNAARKMNMLIDGLLSLSRLGRQQLSKKQIDLSKLVQEVIHELSPEIENREVRWQIARLPRAYGDPIMLRVVFSNLISNALKYTRPRQLAIIEIGTLSSLQAEDIIFIRDNGVGFDMAYADKLFGVFQRLHRADEFDGTGIGLATVHRITQRHGGRIWAEAEVDKGATFCFALPREASA